MLRLLARLFFRICAAIGLLFLIVTCTPVVNTWASWLAGPWGDLRGDSLIVLAGSTVGEGVIGESSYWRAVYAARIWREGGYKWMILSGGGDIIESMRRFVLFSGVPAQAIRMEPQSRNTHESGINLARLLRPEDGKLVLLTSDYHMHRAAAVFRKAGVSVTPAPIPDAIKRGQFPKWRWGVFLELCSEASKIVYYWARGWI